MNELEHLEQYFRDFPGIGPRQAKRFVYYLLRQNGHYLKDLASTIEAVKKDIQSCGMCRQYFFAKKSGASLCSICRDPGREESTLMIVEQDSDLENIEKTGMYEGYYFVLGGALPALEKEPEKKIRVKELLETVRTRAQNGLQEVIVATSYNPEGEGTLRYLKEQLAPLSKKHSFKISALGRGLSTGTELEYVDTDTIKSALENRQ